MTTRCVLENLTVERERLLAERAPTKGLACFMASRYGEEPLELGEASLLSGEAVLELGEASLLLEASLVNEEASSDSGAFLLKRLEG